MYLLTVPKYDTTKNIKTHFTVYSVLFTAYFCMLGCKFTMGSATMNSPTQTNTLRAHVIFDKKKRCQESLLNVEMRHQRGVDVRRRALEGLLQRLLMRSTGSSSEQNTHLERSACKSVQEITTRQGEPLRFQCVCVVESAESRQAQDDTRFFHNPAIYSLMNDCGKKCRESL